MDMRAGPFWRWASRFVIAMFAMQTCMAEAYGEAMLQQTQSALQLVDRAEMRGDKNNNNNNLASYAVDARMSSSLTYPSQARLSPSKRALLLRRSASTNDIGNQRGGDITPYEEPPEYQTAPLVPERPLDRPARPSGELSGGGSSTSTSRKRGSSKTPSTPADLPSVPKAASVFPPRSIDAAKAVYANEPRRLGAFARLHDLAQPLRALREELKALQAAVKKAASQGAGGHGGSSLGDAARQGVNDATALIELRQRLAAAEAAFKATRQRDRQLRWFARDVAKRLGLMPRASERKEARVAAERERIMAALGTPEELEEVGRRLLADRPAPPAGAEALTPDASWEAVADVLARDALEQERLTGDTWLHPGGRFERVSALCLSFYRAVSAAGEGGLGVNVLAQYMSLSFLPLVQVVCGCV